MADGTITRDNEESFRISFPFDSTMNRIYAKRSILSTTIEARSK